jgi:hypothetical protein
MVSPRGLASILHAAHLMLLSRQGPQVLVAEFLEEVVRRKALVRLGLPSVSDSRQRE